MFNLLYYQVVVQLCTTLTDLECKQIEEKYSSAEPQIPANSNNGIPNLGAAMAFILKETNRCWNLRRECVVNDNTSNCINMNLLEQQLQKLCLPFLRIAALLRHHLYHEELPEVSSPQLEFVRMVFFLELVTESMDWNCFNAAKALCFVPGTEKTLPKFWCTQFMNVMPPNDSIRELVFNQHVDWQQPRLLGLPREYERLFTVFNYCCLCTNND